MYPPLSAYYVPETNYLANKSSLCFGFYVICSFHTFIGLTSFMLDNVFYFQTWTSASVIHVKTEEPALTTSTSTAASALRGTLVRTVKQVRVAVLVYQILLKHSPIVSLCNCYVHFSLVMPVKYATMKSAV